MDFNADHFSLFDLPRRFRMEMADLDRSYREVQSRVHPDRFAAAGEADKRLSMQWATRANEAYATLKNPLGRAKYLLQLAGHDLAAETNTAMPAEFLIEQMEWREAVAEARSAASLPALEALFSRLRADLKVRFEELAALIDDQHAWEAAADRVRRLMFLEKLLSEIDDAIAALEV